MALMKLTDAALDDFVGRFREFKDEPIREAKRILNQSGYVEPAGTSKSVLELQLDTGYLFKDRKEFGEYLAFKLHKVGREYFEDNGVWAWITLAYAQQILEGAGSKGKVGEMARWAPSPDWTKRYRHLARGPFNICVEFARHDEVKALLLGGRALDTPGEVYEQLYARNDSSRYSGVLKGLAQLYVRDGEIRAGVSSKDKPGTARRVGKFLNQLSLNYYLEALTTSEFLELLPSEYDRWR